MDLLEANTQPFVVKVWLEETVEEAGRAAWRGHITHVPSGERRYLMRLDDIVAFIVPYLAEMGVKPDLFWRLKRYLGRRKLSLIGVIKREESPREKYSVQRPRQRTGPY